MSIAAGTSLREDVLDAAASRLRRVPGGHISLLQLQATAGNQAVSSLLAPRKVQCGCGGCDSCGPSDMLTYQSDVQHQSFGSLAGFSRGTDLASLTAMLLVDHTTRSNLPRLPHAIQKQPDGFPNCTFKVQRAPDEKTRPPKEKPTKRRDVVLIGEGWEKGGTEWARAIAPNGKIFWVSSLDDAAAKLATVDFPVNNLYIIAHSAPGSVEFGKEEKFVASAIIASKLKGVLSAANAPKVVDFRACLMGRDPKAMGRIGAALGAKSMIAGDCFAVMARAPEHVKMITEQNQVIEIIREPDVTAGIGYTDPGLRAEAEARRWQTFNERLEEYAAARTVSRACIVNPGSKGYFQAGGYFVSVWFNPGPTGGKWVPNESICYSDLKTVSQSVGGPCRLIRVDRITDYRIRSKVTDDLRRQGATIEIERPLPR